MDAKTPSRAVWTPHGLHNLVGSRGQLQPPFLVRWRRRRLEVLPNLKFFLRMWILLDCFPCRILESTMSGLAMW
jgi:hypothetical protein